MNKYEKQEKVIKDLVGEIKRVEGLIPKNFREQEKIVNYENSLKERLRHEESILRDLR